MIDALSASITEGINPMLDEEMEGVEDLQRIMSDVGGIELADIGRNVSETESFVPSISDRCTPKCRH